MDTIKLAIDSAYGIYIPKRFFELYPQFVDHLSENDQEVITNPEHREYWDAWAFFLDTFFVVCPDDHSRRWRLHCDDDVFFVRDDHEFND